MGASGWIYFTPYQADSEKALADLRQHVYDSGDFYNYLARTKEYLEAVLKPESEARKEWDSMWSLSHRIPQDPAERLQVVIRQLEKQTLDTIHLHDEGSGTQGILDIRFITQGYDDIFGARKLHMKEIQSIFGTSQPTHEQVEAAFNRPPGAFGINKKWTASYFVVYRDNQPSEYCFSGVSGD